MPPFSLSANENPYPPLPSVRELIRNESGRINRYPDRFVTELTGALSERFSVPAEHLAIGAGSVGVTAHLLHAVLGEAGGEVVYAWPSFEAYPHLTHLYGGTAVEVPLRADHSHDLDAMAGAVTDRTRLVIVCNPNNPTSTVVDHAELERFLDRLPGHVLVVLDEAYREFVRDARAVPDGISLYRDRPQVIVLRTFSKAYGLAGLRVGFAVCHEAVAARIRKSSVPFGVSSVAQSAAVASLEAEAELLERVEELVKERERVQDGLRGAGLGVPSSQANFVWLPLGADTEDFAAACEIAGVRVRAFPGEGARVTIGEPEANDIVLRVAARFGGDGA
ncbi:histidinol-phosphate transaminase [Streptomyces sp. APSN-46.1]|uniref:histidinol-phosphate transaminase n=1 Tax=Streptomyces sp. APSN-46.1 TaxID=2929049 RepID=UPI001FB3CBB6|nr:histidinol-phosphate transaminase [Streptomyces sp. APSN-46.1]MCJ1678223.1 histidinol-phosphate transaminase [Streptomyces sp. APSN-46.1]